ncbi:serine/threonine-protein kinase [Nonomuraea composti]|uniref:serine/threonine-protein kinase n=1 Tax=Nonomuraea composti TaxID=2720023 RepID=UPI0019818869|nr:serine/threonine-protein kinase [Nonomuraea sp. FMUSA5-5]
MSDSVGLVVGGRYRLLRTIGKGGMGMVWHAHDEVLGRDVAVKEVLPPPNMSGPEREEFAVRTFREARAAGRVAHPGVATVYDVLEERGHPWIVMQLVQSRTLGALIREEGPMPPAQAAGIGLQLLEALRAAHAAGVLHRDVKPDNVLLSQDGRAVLTDFGIATTEDEAPVTRTGILVGTPAFMAPERAAGGRATPASDLWSVGVTLYLAVEGHSPFQRDTALATLGAVMHAEPRPLARAGVLAPVLLGLLRKDPAERMSLEEAERRLTAILTGAAPERTGPVTVPAGHRRPRRRLLPLAAIVGGALAVGLVTGGAAWWSQRPRQPVTPSPVPAVVTTEKTTVYESPTPELKTTRPESTAPSPSGPPSPPQSRPQSHEARTSSTPPPTREQQPRSPSPTAKKKTPTKEPKPTKTKEEATGRAPGQIEGTGNGRALGKGKKKKSA